MALTASRELSRYVDQELRSFKVAGSTTIYKGALVSIQTDGYVAPLTAAELLAGIAYDEIVNAGADGAKSVRIYTQGDFEHALSGAAIANVGDAIYGTDDGTLTFTSTSNTYVGFCVDVPSSGTVIVRLDGFRTAP